MKDNMGDLTALASLELSFREVFRLEEPICQQSSNDSLTPLYSLYLPNLVHSCFIELISNTLYLDTTGRR